MTIKHLVIAGGGALGLRYLGALEKLNIDGFWNMEDITSIYATSVGSIIGAFICLKYNWDVLKQYIIERPWHDAFKLSGQQLFDSYHKKGLYDKKLAEIIFKPLLKAKDLSVNITLKELYDISKINLHLFTFNINKFETVELSHITYPDLELIQAITMSCSIPGVFIPTIIGEDCFIDGGIMYNFPINFCLRDHSEQSEILGINCCFNNDANTNNNVSVTEDSTLLEYIMCITLNSMKYISTSIQQSIIDNTVKCHTNRNPISLDIITQSVVSRDFRNDWIKQGEEDATSFLVSIATQQNKLINTVTEQYSKIET
jgi:predicted acylesterase/phospholipase RssA